MGLGLGSWNVTLPNGDNGSTPWWVYVLLLVSFVEGLGEWWKHHDDKPKPPTVAVEDCERICYGYIAKYGPTLCECMPYREEGAP